MDCKILLKMKNYIYVHVNTLKKSNVNFFIIQTLMQYVYAFNYFSFLFYFCSLTWLI